MDWTKLWNFEPGILEVALRLACAMLVGLVIGTEREYTNRPAGMRTHILVALGACVVSITGEILFYHYSALGATPDPARLSAQVITGVGFLGAGTILRKDASVKGLTTAASLWAVACLGIASGFGYYALALLGMVFIFITLTVFEYIQHKWMRTGQTSRQFHLQTTDVSRAMETVDTYARKYGVNVEHMAVETLDDGFLVSFQGELSGSRSTVRCRKFMEALIKDEAIRSCKQEAKI